MKCYDAASAAFGWNRRNPQPGSMRGSDWLIDWGCATATYPTQVSPAVARLKLLADGSARVEIAAHDVGTSAYTAMAQIAAKALSIKPDQVSVAMGDTLLPPGATPAQRTAAFEKLKLGAVEEIGNLVPPTTRLKSTASLCKGSADVTGGVNAHEATNDAKTMFAFDAEFVEVRVHARTREIRVPRIVGAFAAGRIMNPRTAHSQLMGGLIWGIGSALHEHTEIDKREARYMNDNLGEYLIPVNADIRQVDVILVPEVDDEVNPAGAKGLGELANVGTAAAIANAVFHATGRRIRELPITIDKLIQA